MCSKKFSSVLESSGKEGVGAKVAAAHQKLSLAAPTHAPFSPIDAPHQDYAHKRIFLYIKTLVLDFCLKAPLECIYAH